MSRYDDTWPYEATITIDNTAGAPGAQDATLVIPAEWDEFWENVDTNGEDIRVTAEDGVTLATWDLNGFNKATRAGTLEIDNFVATAAKMYPLHLYWGKAAQATGITAFVPGAPKTGYIELSSPTAPVITVQEERPGETVPRVRLSKSVDEVAYWWFDFSGVLARRRAKHNASHRLEEISQAYYDVLDGGATQAAMQDATKTRISGPLVKVLVKAGTTGSDYIVVCTIVTTEGRTLQQRALLQVRNVAD